MVANQVGTISFLLILFSLLNCSSPKVDTAPVQPVTEPTKTTLAANSFVDIVILKNGQILEKVKATFLKDSYVVTDATGKTNIFSKKEVLQVKQGALTNLTEETNVESNPILSWSEYQGNLKWSDANTKCQGIGMRLATIPELKAAYNTGIMKSWKEVNFISGGYYWSSTPSKYDLYYFFDSSFGGSYDGIHTDYNFNKDAVRNDYHFVRCIR